MQSPCVRVVVHPCTFVSIFQVGGIGHDVAYPKERRAAVLKKMQPPNNVPLRQLSREEGISEATLHSWRNEPRRFCRYGSIAVLTAANCRFRFAANSGHCWSARQVRLVAEADAA